MTEKIKLLKRTGIFLLITGTLSLFADQFAYRSTAYNTTIFNILGALTGALILVGAFLYWRSRQYVAKAVANRITSDSKPDVVYLRVFGTDPHFLATAMGFYSGWLTDEEQLGEVLQPIGELVAIGKPGETLPTPGAARLYAPDAGWKTKIRDQIQTARLVVIRAGTSEGLLWELKQAVQVMNPKKLLILILRMGKKDYEAFRKEADRICNAIFPKFHDRAVDEATAIFVVRTIVSESIGPRYGNQPIVFKNDPVTVSDVLAVIDRLCGGSPDGWQLLQRKAQLV